jgi:hypothetical protein
VRLKWLGNEADCTLSSSSVQQNYLYSPINLCGMHRTFTFNNMKLFNGTTPSIVDLVKSCTITSDSKCTIQLLHIPQITHYSQTVTLCKHVFCSALQIVTAQHNLIVEQFQNDQNYQIRIIDYYICTLLICYIHSSQLIFTSISNNIQITALVYETFIKQHEGQISLSILLQYPTPYYKQYFRVQNTCLISQ